MDIYGALGIADTDYAFINTIGQSVVYDATLQVLGDHNADLQAVSKIFVEGGTVDHTIKYKLGDEGFLGRMGPRSEAPMTKPNGGWNVSFTLEEFGASIGWDRIAMAKATIQQYDLMLKGILKKDRNTLRREILRAALEQRVAYVQRRRLPGLDDFASGQRRQRGLPACPRFDGGSDGKQLHGVCLRGHRDQRHERSIPFDR